jgi:hypothetical protein
MKKQIVIAIFSLTLAVPSLFAVTTIVSGTTRVDGVINSTQAVITSHLPLFSWEFTGIVSSFTLTVSASPSSASTLWSYSASTSTVNTLNNITRVPYNIDGNAAVLNADTLYYWQVTVYDESGTPVPAPITSFTTTTSATTLTGSKFDLEIDWNNPFNPSLNEITKFRFTSKDVDRKLQLRVFTLSGVLVREWPQQVAIQNAYYTQEWDGKNSNGEMVARGIYLVNLLNVGDNASVTRKVAVINGKNK